MNWTDLEELKHRAEIGEMSSKESTNIISSIWYLIFNHYKIVGYNQAPPSSDIKYWDDHNKLIEISQTIYRVNDHSPTWFKGWINSMPTEVKATELMKKVYKESL